MVSTRRFIRMLLVFDQREIAQRAHERGERASGALGVLRTKLRGIDAREHRLDGAKLALDRGAHRLGKTDLLQRFERGRGDLRDGGNVNLGFGGGVDLGEPTIARLPAPELHTLFERGDADAEHRGDVAHRHGGALVERAGTGDLFRRDDDEAHGQHRIMNYSSCPGANPISSPRGARQR